MTVVVVVVVVVIAMPMDSKQTSVPVSDFGFPASPSLFVVFHFGMFCTFRHVSNNFPGSGCMALVEAAPFGGRCDPFLKTSSFPHAPYPERVNAALICREVASAFDRQCSAYRSVM